MDKSGHGCLLLALLLVSHPRGIASRSSVAPVEMSPRCSNRSQEFIVPVEGKARCCRKCPLGEGMVQLCRGEDRDTQCRPCIAQSEFSATESASAKCRRCRKCQSSDPNIIAIKPCTPLSDTICGCRRGFVMSEQTGRCEPCPACPQGLTHSTPCDLTMAVNGCYKCQRSQWPVNQQCQSCSICPTGWTEVEPCTWTQDRQCCPSGQRNCSREAFYQARDVSLLNALRSRQFHQTKQINLMIPIACSLMGLIILTLTVYVFYKLWRQRRVFISKKKGNHLASLSQYEHSIGAPSMPRCPGKPASKELDTSAENQSDKTPLTVAFKNGLYDKLTVTTIPDETIKQLAEKLDEKELQAIVRHLRPEPECEGEDAKRAFLRWASAEHRPANATVGRLLKNLHRVGRGDLCQIIHDLNLLTCEDLGRL